MPLAPSFDTCGFFARDAETLRQTGDVLLPRRTVAANRVMIASDLFARLAPAVRDALAPAVEKIQKALGAAAPATVYDRPAAEVYDAFRFLQAHEIYAIHGQWIESRKPVLGAPIAERFVFARNVTDAQATASRAVRESFAAHLHGLYADGGLMIAPALHGPAPRLDDSAATLDAYRHEAMAFLCPAGMAGLPQLVMPACVVDGGPVGISLLAAPGGDRALLDAAAKIARA
jgi:amidase